MTKLSSIAPIDAAPWIRRDAFKEAIVRLETLVSMVTSDGAARPLMLMGQSETPRAKGIIAKNGAVGGNALAADAIEAAGCARCPDLSVTDRLPPPPHHLRETEALVLDVAPMVRTEGART